MLSLRKIRFVNVAIVSILSIGIVSSCSQSATTDQKQRTLSKSSGNSPAEPSIGAGASTSPMTNPANSKNKKPPVFDKSIPGPSRVNNFTSVNQLWDKSDLVAVVKITSKKARQRAAVTANYFTTELIEPLKGKNIAPIFSTIPFQPKADPKVGETHLLFLNEFRSVKGEPGDGIYVINGIWSGDYKFDGEDYVLQDGEADPRLPVVIPKNSVNYENFCRCEKLLK